MVIRYPPPPYVELAFFSRAWLPAADALVHLVEAALQTGSSLAGPVLVAEPAIRDGSFATVHDSENRVRIVKNVEDLRHLATNPAMTVLQAELYRGQRESCIEVATIVSISVDAARRGDSHPVAIWRGTEDWGMDVGNRRTARRLTADFHHMVSVLQPQYAAITIEEDLPGPSDLGAEPSVSAFRDCWVNDDILNPRLGKVVDRYITSGAYVARVAAGSYLSCSPLLNPKGSSVGLSQAMELSSLMSQTLAQRLIGPLLGSPRDIGKA